MNDYLAIMIARAEHEQRNRSPAAVPEYAATAVVDRPGWLSRQAGHLLCTLGSGLSSLGQRLTQEQAIGLETPSGLGTE